MLARAVSSLQITRLVSQMNQRITHFVIWFGLYIHEINLIESLLYSRLLHVLKITLGAVYRHNLNRLLSLDFVINDRKYKLIMFWCVIHQVSRWCIHFSTTAGEPYQGFCVSSEPTGE